MKITDITKQGILTEASKYDPVDFVGGDKELRKYVISQGKTVISFLKKNCKKWLMQTNKGKLYVYRGYKDISETKLAFTKTTRPNRQPVDTDSEGHKLFNKIIKLCGKTANRSNAVFVSGDDDMAETYGTLFVVVPIGDFKYTWHTEISDWHGSDIESDAEIQPEDVKIDAATKKKLTAKWGAEYDKKYKKKAAPTKDTLQDLLNILRKAGYKGQKNSLSASLIQREYDYIHFDIYDAKFWGTRTNLKGSYFGAGPQKALAYFGKAYLGANKQGRTALKKLAKAEIQKKQGQGLIQTGSKKDYIQSKMYEYRNKLYDEMIKKSGEISDELIKKRVCPKIKGDDKSLGQAISSGNEIMIACKKVIAINPDFYKDVILPLLNNKTPRFDPYDILRGFQDW